MVVTAEIDRLLVVGIRDYIRIIYIDPDAWLNKTRIYAQILRAGPIAVNVAVRDQGRLGVLTGDGMQEWYKWLLANTG